MLSTRFDVEKFAGSGGFALWKIKMKALMTLQGTVASLEGEDKLPATMSATDKASILERGFSTIILSLGDEVLRQVRTQTTAKGLWDKLEEIYNVRTLANRLYSHYLKQKMYTFKVLDEKASSGANR